MRSDIVIGDFLKFAVQCYQEKDGRWTWMKQPPPSKKPILAFCPEAQRKTTKAIKKAQKMTVRQKLLKGLSLSAHLLHDYTQISIILSSFGLTCVIKIGNYLDRCYGFGKEVGDTSKAKYWYRLKINLNSANRLYHFMLMYIYLCLQNSAAKFVGR